MSIFRKYFLEKKIKMSKVKKKTVINIGLGIIGLVIIMSIIDPSSGAIYKRPEFNDSLYASWHPGSFCIPCHYTLMSTEQAQNISVGCQCHQYKPEGSTKYNIDMTQIFKIHKDVICVRCHIGFKNPDEVTPQEFHSIMPIDCKNCHNYTANGEMEIPDKRNCSDCHAGGDPHIVHSKNDNLAKICVACHGENFASQYISGNVKINISQQGNVSIQPVPQINVQYPTIGNFLANLLRSIGILK
jgi:hypothetical protein